MSHIIFLDPENGVEIPPDEPYMDLMVRAAAACETINLLTQAGATFDDTPADPELIDTLVTAYASNPVLASQQVTNNVLPQIPTATLLETQRILHEFGQSTLVKAHHIRNIVTNGLVIDSQNPDPKIRLKAYELLGKFTDVGLFTERKEIVKSKSDEELKSKLEEKIRALRTTTVQKGPDGVYQ
jgi:hypothetical protein